MHKSQGFGSAERRGTLLNYFDLLAGEPATTDLFEGIDTSLVALSRRRDRRQALQQAADTFDPNKPAKSIPLLLAGATTRSTASRASRRGRRANPWIEVKQRELLDAIRACAGHLPSTSRAARLRRSSPGGEMPVSVTRRQSLRLSVHACRWSRRATRPEQGAEHAAREQRAGQDRHHASRSRPTSPTRSRTGCSSRRRRGSYTVDDQQLIGRARQSARDPDHRHARRHADAHAHLHRAGGVSAGPTRCRASRRATSTSCRR